MGAFCVFGVSKGVCRGIANRKVATFELANGKKRALTQEEWVDRRDAHAAQLFEQSTRPVRISPEFDAPQFCHDWLAVAPGEVKLARVMARGPKIDKKGKAVVRGGAPVLTWVEYAPPARAA